MRMSRKTIHTVKREDGWANVKAGAGRASSTHETQAEAIQAARQIARNQGLEHVIHGKDNRIRESNSYGNDPYPPKG